jgi:hypothetical protein
MLTLAANAGLVGFKFAPVFQASLAVWALVDESELRFASIHDNLYSGPSKWDNLLRAPIATARDRAATRARQFMSGRVARMQKQPVGGRGLASPALKWALADADVRADLEADGQRGS